MWVGVKRETSNVGCFLFDVMLNGSTAQRQLRRMTSEASRFLELPSGFHPRMGHEFTNGADNSWGFVDGPFAQGDVGFNVAAAAGCDNGDAHK